MVLAFLKAKVLVKHRNIKDYGELDTMRKIVEENVRKKSA